MINLDVPFVSNTPDGRHCYQACIKMILGHFSPQENVSFGDLDKITQISHYYTWEYAGDLWLQNQGFQIRYIELFDHKRFSEEGGLYLYEYAGAEVASDQIKNSDIEQEQKLALQVLDKIEILCTVPNFTDLKEFLEVGSMLLCNINSYVLDGEEGYEGHSILVIGYDKEGFIIHDPGLPARPNFHVSYTIFEKAWAYPSQKVKKVTVYTKS